MAVCGRLLTGVLLFDLLGFPALAAGQPTEAAPTFSADAVPFPRIRTRQIEILDRLEEMYEGSPSFRVIVDALGQSNLIVWIAHDFPHMARVPERDGRTTFMGAAGGSRYIRIGLRPGLLRRSLVTMLAHELRHALEIAQAPSIVNAHSFEAHYARIGEWRGSRGYDTEPARLAGWTVWDEVESARLRIAAAEAAEAERVTD